MTDNKHDCCSNTTSSKPENARYDLAVIGAGSAGFSAAITAAEKGARVALIGYGTIGGTCVNIGCVPSKTMIRAAETLHQAREAGRFDGISAKASITDWKAVMAQKQALVDELRGAKYEALLPQYEGVTYIEGKAKLVDNGVLVNEDLIMADKIIIATGSSPSLPLINGMADVPYLTSTTVLELDHLPTSMIVIGGGVIGVELGQMFARLGTKITLLCRSRLLPSEEPEISAALETYLKAEGIKVVCGVTYKSIQSQKGISLDYEVDGSNHENKAEQVLVATGRKPNSQELGLAELGIEMHPNGGIKIDDRMLTNRENIYAVGDVTGQDMFVYMAAYGAKIATKNAMNSNSFSYDNTAMPSVVFTDPQVANVGLTQAMAEARGIETKTSVLTLDNVLRALAARDTRGLIKLVAEKETGKLIGAHIIAPEGADSIQTAAIAIKQGMTYRELGDMIFPYLTTVEGLKLAAQTFDKDVAKLSCCAG